jgi:cysteine desulfurase
MPKRMYLDNAAATPIDPGVVRAMVQASTIIGNPSAVAFEGLQAAQFLLACRTAIADFLHAAPGEIVCTASGSEGNTLAILGLVQAMGPGKWNIVTTPTEHTSVLEAVRHAGVQVRMAAVDEQGRINLEQLGSLIDERTILVSLMYANNEIGTIHPLRAVTQLVRTVRKKYHTAHPYVHTDACQATAWLPMDVQNLGVDLLTLNGAKVYGPRGAGALFVRRGIPLAPRTLGGDQEHGMRAGTEDLMSIAGLAEALKGVRTVDPEAVKRLRDMAWQGIQKAIPDVRLNGPELVDRLANNLNFSIPGIQSEVALLEFDAEGIALSAGSACTAKHTGPSHVLEALGIPKKYLHSALRISLSRHTTKADIARFLKVFPQVIEKARRSNLK